MNCYRYTSHWHKGSTEPLLVFSAALIVIRRRTRLTSTTVEPRLLAAALVKFQHAAKSLCHNLVNCDLLDDDVLFQNTSADDVVGITVYN
jgi:hypothetical protein